MPSLKMDVEQDVEKLEFDMDDWSGINRINPVGYLWVDEDWGRLETITGDHVEHVDHVACLLIS